MLISSIIFVVIVLLYIFKLMPAVPLSLKSSSIYNSVVKRGDYYTASLEDKSIFSKVINPRTFKYLKSEGAYFFSSVHAPTSIETVITHRWLYYDKSSDKYKVVAEIPFTMRGSRDEGYRGYSQLINVKPGNWRVEVLSVDGRVIGRYSFELKEADLETKFKNVNL